MTQRLLYLCCLDAVVVFIMDSSSSFILFGKRSKNGVIGQLQQQKRPTTTTFLNKTIAFYAKYTADNK